MDISPRNRRARLLAGTALFIATVGQAAAVNAHGGHKEFSPAFIDPLVTHHAVLEDEFKLNAFGYQGRRLADTLGHERTGTMELAYAFTDDWGFEVFIPLRGLNLDAQGPIGIGDLELDPIKYSFYQTPELVLTATVAATVPTGDVAQGLGEGRWNVAPHLLIDRAFGNWAWQTNLAVEADVAVQSQAPSEVPLEPAVLGGALELNTALAYSFFWGRHVVSPLIEVNAEHAAWGDEAGTTEVALTPGVKWAYGGWHVGAGVQLPVTASRGADWTAMVQAGYHLNWARLLREGNPFE